MNDQAVAHIFIMAIMTVFICFIVCVTNYNLMTYKLDHIVMDNKINKENK